jgi:CheY-like chemotaxis protein
MTRVLVVQRDPAVAQRMTADLQSAGFEVEHCTGPAHEPCPIVGGLPCPLADRADVLLYDALIAGDGEGGHALIAELRDAYADLPVILTSADPRLAWVAREGPERVIPFVGYPDGKELVDAVETALGEQGLAV